MGALKILVGLALAGMILIPPGVSAQKPSPFSFDGAIGLASGHGGEFDDRRLLMLRLAASARYWMTPEWGAYAELGIEGEGQYYGSYLVCTISSRGGCLQSFPRVSGPSLTLGAVSSSREGNRGLEARTGLGIAAYTVEHTRLGAGAASADLAAFFAPHVAVAGQARLLVIPRYRHDKLTVLGVTVGLRIR